MSPKREANGYRYYSEEDVARLMRVKSAVNAGLKISEAVRLLHHESSPPRLVEEPELGNDGRGSRAQSFERSEASKSSGYEPIQDELYECLTEYRGEDAMRLFSRLQTMSFSARLHGVFFPVLRRVGEAWARGELSIAQEHYASGAIRTHLAAVLVSTVQPSTAAPLAACTTLPHDDHEIGALALSIQLMLWGFRVAYLGPRLPVLDLAQYARRQSPQIICVSCITLSEPESMAAYYEGMRAIAALGVRVVLGGACLDNVSADETTGLETHASWQDFRPDPTSPTRAALPAPH